MREEIRQEVTFFAASFQTGVWMIWGYLLLVLLRRVIRHGMLAVHVEDFLYWCVTALVIFSTVLQVNHGALRWYCVAAILLGVWSQWGMLCFLRRICIKLLKKWQNRGRMT